MSSPSDLASMAAQQVLSNQCQMASCALYGYYFLLSFGAEVDLMWKREFSRGTMVFLAVRYLTLVNNCVAVAAISLYTVDQMSCDFLVILSEILETANYLLFTLLAISRAYSLLVFRPRLQKALPTFLLFTGFSVWTIYLYINIHSIAMVMTAPLYGCVRSNTLSLVLYTRLSDAYRLCLLINDALVIVTTLATFWSESARWSPLGRFLLYDSIFDAAYWVVLLIISIVQIAVPQSSVEFNPLQNIFDTLNSILVSQLLLEAREIDDVFQKRKYESPTSFRLSCDTFAVDEASSWSNRLPSYSELSLQDNLGNRVTPLCQWDGTPLPTDRVLLSMKPAAQTV